MLILPPVNRRIRATSSNNVMMRALRRAAERW
jgi:hypothetical protein